VGVQESSIFDLGLTQATGSDSGAPFFVFFLANLVYGFPALVIKANALVACMTPTIGAVPLVTGPNRRFRAQFEVTRTHLFDVNKPRRSGR